MFVDYERSSWKHMDEDTYIPSKYAKYICGEKPLPIGSNLIIKSGYVVNENDGNYNSIIQTGMGSVYGGHWKPKKPEDERFFGELGEIKTTYKNNYHIDTKIGEDGRAVCEGHYTDHGFPKYHTNPHDHPIYWDDHRGNPQMGRKINYPKKRLS